MVKKLLILLLVSSLFLISCGKKENVEIGVTEGKKAPDFTLKNIDDKDVKLSDYKGKVVVVNFFGVWCPWCIREMPGFMNVYKDYKSKNVELLVVDVGDTKDTVIKYLKDNNFDIKPVMDDKQKVSKLYKVTGFPTSFIIDEKGIIKKVHQGYMDEKLLRTILSTMVK